MSIKEPKILKIRKRNSRVESKTQQSAIKWFSLQYPKLNLLLFSIPNGTNAGGKMVKGKDGKMIPLAASIAKAEGLKRGVADMFLSIPGKGFYGMYIEMKTADGTQSKEQKAFQAEVERFGYKYVLCRSVDQFIKEVNNYLS